ncbi:DUF3732 domain-containing protein [Dactylosporangium sp. CA-152071]|uniref:DUF3732 domain-containing protein n=1 Tax=Dactylosporangium sp. CA-152071 TaxID=3239933 RepID=UPI003D8EFF96
MQLLGIALYSHGGLRRDVRFKPNALNVLTGRSGTGKSAVLDIVEFCLGRSTVALPIGRITQSTAWFAALLQFGEDRLVLARPNPEGKSTSAAMIMAGSSDLDFPRFEDLRENADREAIREELDARLGIESFRVEPDANSLRYGFEVSVAQALLLCLQKQGEVANQNQLFHRQTEGRIAQAIKDTLPYFIGASGPRQVALAQNLLSAQRALRRAERDLSAVENEAESQDSSLAALGVLAVNEGIVDRVVLELPNEQLAATLLQAAFSVDEPTYVDGQPSEERERLVEERDALRSDLSDLESQLSLVRKIDREEESLAGELSAHRGRLISLQLLPQIEASESTCPLCQSALEEPDASVSEIAALLERIDSELSRTQGVRPRHRRGLEEIQERIVQIKDQMRQNLASLNAVAESDRALQSERDRAVRAAYVRGRLVQALDGRSAISSGAVEQARAAVARHLGRVSELEDLIAAEDPIEEMRSRLNLIARDMTDLARALGLEHSEHNVRLDVKNLTVVADTPEGPRPLSRIGSAENHVGYHLVTHLALHRWFVEQHRPVPRFLMLDQPTQAFFPEEVSDASEVEDADWEAVRRMFQLLLNFVSATEGRMQIIVCDHANLADDWFQDALVDNWRGGRALIPSDWP